MPRNLFIIGTKLFISIFSLVLSPVLALAANDLSTGQGAQIELTTPPMTIFLQTGGQVDSLTVNPSSFSFTLSQNSSLVATSSTPNIFETDFGDFVTDKICDDSPALSSITLSKTTTGTQTVTVTIGASCKPTGGGGGGGGTSAPSTTTTTTTTTTSTTTPQTTATTAAPTTTAQSAFTEPQIQSILSLLAAFNIDQSTVSEVEGILRGQTTQISFPTSSASCNFTRNLQTGDRGEDVKCLQRYLNSAGFQLTASGLGSPGNETDFFGALTREAIVNWQNVYANQVLVPVGLSAGTGFWGPSSRAYYNSLVK